LLIMVTPTFYCREWVFSKLRQYFNEPVSSKNIGGIQGCFILGDSGCGKTAICQEIISPTVCPGDDQRQLHRQMIGYHLCDCTCSAQPSASNNDCVRKFVDALCNQFMSCSILQNVADLLNETLMNVNQINPADMAEKLLCHVLQKVQPLPDNPLFVIVDDVDSCMLQSRQETCCRLLDMLYDMRGKLPGWLRFLFTTRRLCRRTQRRFVGHRKIVVDDLQRSSVVRDVQQYILQRLDESENLRIQVDYETADALNRLHIKSNGCLLYLKIILDTCTQCKVDKSNEKGHISFKQIHEIPSTLNGLYLYLCQKLMKHETRGWCKVLLEVLLANGGTMNFTQNQLFTIVKLADVTMSKNQFLSILKCLQPLLDSKNHCQLVHPSFGEWLTDVKYCTPSFLCHPDFGCAYLALWYSYRARHGLSEEEVVDFARHLVRISVKCSVNWFSEQPTSYSSPAMFLVQSGIPVQNMVLKTNKLNEATVRLLIEAGADFVNVGFKV